MVYSAWLPPIHIPFKRSGATVVEKIGHIKNPMTVIAIFAGIAEISGTVVLPFLQPHNQFIYIWFLMFFPAVLVILFFATLNFNREALYSPSDYKDEKNFMNSVRRATPTETLTKLRQETDEVEQDIKRSGLNEDQNQSNTSKDQPQDNQPNAQPDTQAQPEPDNRDNHVPVPSAEKTDNGSDNGTTRDHGVTSLRYRYSPSSTGSHSRLMSDVALAETLAIAKLGTQFGINFKRHVKVEVPGARSITFDGVAFLNDTMHAAEVKLFASNKIDVSRFYPSMIEASYASKSWTEKHKLAFIYHIFIVGDLTPAQQTKASQALATFANGIELRIETHFSSMKELNDAELINHL